jgi:hypothetical protein
MEVGGQLQASAALQPEKEPLVPCEQKNGRAPQADWML